MAKPNKKNSSQRNRTNPNVKKGQKPLNKGNSNKFEREAVDQANLQADMSKSNPFSWYDSYSAFTKDAGTISFALPLGESVVFPSGDKVGAAGIYVLCFYPTIGYSANLDSAFNRSINRFYTYLRSVKKSASRYDAADIGMYLVAQDSLLMFSSLITRAYKVAQLFTPMNKYYPRVLLQAMGFDLSILNNLAEFRAYINRFNLQLGRYYIPDRFKMNERHRWMCQGMYLDSQTTRAQTYLFVPEGFWQYDNTVTTGSQLTFIPWMDQTKQPAGLKLHTLADIQGIGDTLLQQLRNDEDFGNISGDLYTAYGGGGLRLDHVADLDAILPVYDTTVLSQIENATFVGLAVNVDGDPFTIRQDPSVNNGAVIFTPAFMGSTAKHGTANDVYMQPAFTHPGQLMNMHMDSPSPEAVIEASRLMVSVSTGVSATNTTSFFRPDSYGVEVLSRGALYVPNDDGTFKALWTTTNGIWDGQETSAEKLATALEMVAISEQFDWAPLLYVTQGGANWSPDIRFIAGDLDNFTYITHQQIDTMHEASLLSLFDVPDFT